MWSSGKIDTTFWLIMWLNYSLTYAVWGTNADGQELFTHVLSHSQNSVMSDIIGIIGRTLTWVSYMF